MSQRSFFSCKIPVLTQLRLVHGCPFEYHGLHPARQLSFQNLDWVNSNDRLILRIGGMEMGRFMFSIENADNDAEKLRYSRQKSFLHLHIEQRRAVYLLGTHLEVILVVSDQAGELPVAVGARIEARVELVQSVAHVVEARPTVFLLGNFVGLADDWHRVVFIVRFGDGCGSSGGRGSAGGRGRGRRRFPARAFSRRGNP